MPTKLLSVKCSNVSADTLALKLRRHEPPIFARIQNDAVLFDLRTIQPKEDVILQQALVELITTQEDT